MPTEKLRNDRSHQKTQTWFWAGAVEPCSRNSIPAPLFPRIELLKMHLKLWEGFASPRTCAANNPEAGWLRRVIGSVLH